MSSTYTLNFSYGSGLSVDGAGFLLNNQMDDFVSKPGVPNGYGLLGREANAIEPRKRPLSSMSPVIVFRDGEPYLLTGSPGGSQIITSVVQMLVNVIDHQMNIADATSIPRMHHQWYPDQISVEWGFSPDTLRELERRGHQFVVIDEYGIGALQTVTFDDGYFQGASDPRREGAGAASPGSITSPTMQ